MGHEDKKNMKVIKQSTYETCLASALLMLIGEPWNRNKEIEIWKQGWKFSYLISQLNYVAKKYKKDFSVYVENWHYFIELQKEKGRGVELINAKIDMQSVKKLLNSSPVIVYLDNYYLQRVIHTPHFVLAERYNGDIIEIADPYDGKEKKISSETFKKAIISLRNHLKYSPVLVRLGQ